MNRWRGMNKFINRMITPPMLPTSGFTLIVLPRPSKAASTTTDGSTVERAIGVRILSL
jgi:hypothetical protein